MSNSLMSAAEAAKAYAQEIIRRGSRDRYAGRKLDENPYALATYSWPDASIEAIRIIKGFESFSAVREALAKLDPEKQTKVLNNPKVKEPADKIRATRSSAHTLWEKGWLSGLEPGQPIDLLALLRVQA